MENSYPENNLDKAPVRILSFENLAKLAFFLYLFFVFFGTNLPFQSDELDVTEYATNPIRQLLFSSLYFLALLSILPSFKKIFAIILEEKFLTMFLLWILASVLWSHYFDISFKRWLQVLGSYIVCLSALIRFRDSEEVLRYFRIITYSYLIITFISVFTIPAASANYQGQIVWRGLAPQKNGLGQIVLICGMISVISINFYKSGSKYFDYSMLFISIILLVGSKSTTSFLTTLILSTLALLTYLLTRFEIAGMLKWFTYLFILLAVLLTANLLIIFPTFISDMFAFLGKDPTFTGRTDLWLYLLGIASSGNIFLGSGFGGFWVYGSPNLEQLYSLVNDTPIQAHNGYVDLFIETGIIGIVILLFIIVWYFYNLRFSESKQFWKYFFIATLLLNLQEATLFKLNEVTSVLFIFSYLSLFTQLVRQKPRGRQNSSPAIVYQD